MIPRDLTAPVRNRIQHCWREGKKGKSRKEKGSLKKRHPTEWEVAKEKRAKIATRRKVTWSLSNPCEGIQLYWWQEEIKICQLECTGTSFLSDLVNCCCCRAKLAFVTGRLINTMWLVRVEFTFVFYASRKRFTWNIYAQRGTEHATRGGTPKGFPFPGCAGNRKWLLITIDINNALK